MIPGFRKYTLILQLTLLLVSLAVISGCWIPLPEETAIVVEVLDAQGGPVDGVNLLLDSTDTLITGSQLDAGQVFKTLSDEDDHTIQLDTATLIDPQGGVGWVPLASQISGELVPLSFWNRPFAGGSDVLIVPVNKGEITVVTVYLDDIQKSPADNQWLTDGLDAANNYRTANTDEFGSNLRPTFWWRQDPSLGSTITYTFQLWEDDDADTRFPLGVIDHARYTTALDPSDTDYIQPDWQVPLAGIQRAEAGGINQVTLWSSQASDASNPVDYDLYYAPTSQWNNTDWESNPVLRDVAPEGAFDGAARKFMLGTGTTNPGIILKNDVQYTFALRARDGASNLDTTGITSRRKGTPSGSSSTLGAVTNFTAVADSTEGGSIDLEFNCTPFDNLRIYAAPSSDFAARPYDVRFIRESITCAIGSPNSYTLTDLVNSVPYLVGIEPFDASGNVGTATSILSATPSSLSSVIDTTAPSVPVFTATSTGNGNVNVTVETVTDASSVIRRIYWSPELFTPNEEAMMYTDRPASPQVTVSLTDIPNGIPFNYVVRAIDAFGNSSRAASQGSLSGGDGIGPAWAADDPGFFTTFSYSQASTLWPLGVTWSYGSVAGGFELGQNPAQGQGEYVWRIIQENPDRGVSIDTKLGAFYTYSGYYYASTESGSLNMSSPSSNADHLDAFSFVETAILSADVMGTPFTSANSSPNRYQQRTASQFSSSLSAGSWTTNQLTILYNTDEDGQAVVSQEVGGGYLGILQVVATNKQLPLPTPEPHLQGKAFQLSYFTDVDEFVTFPVPLFGGDIFYLGTLDDPDYQDPLW